jgi:hypothetical protein
LVQERQSSGSSWLLEGALERALAEAFAKDYRELVAQARARILQK